MKQKFVKPQELNLRNVVLLDIDHTLSDATWRDDMIVAQDWDSYHAASVQDHPNEDICKLVDYLAGASDHKFIVVTGRNEKFRDTTSKWLLKFNVRIDEILMRPDKNFDPAPEVKRKLLERRFGKNWPARIAWAIDDSPAVCEMYRAHCISTMQFTARLCEHNP